MDTFSAIIRDQSRGIPYVFSLKPPENILRNTLIVPFIVACLSVDALFVQAFTSWCAREPVNQGHFGGIEESENSTRPKLISDAPAKVNDGFVFTSFMVARLVGCLTLVGLSSASLVGNNEGEPPSLWPPDNNAVPELLMLITYIYASILALIAIWSVDWRQSLIRHNITTLLVTLSVYLYRDVWPLATYTLEPADIVEGNILWAKIFVLTLTAVVIPLFIPRLYSPIDPNDIAQTPNPEQTACLFSAFLYQYLDPIIFKAKNKAHLSSEELPPLADYDRSKILTTQAFPYIDPFRRGRKRHIFYGLVHYFAFDYFSAVVAITFYLTFSFASPIAINRILTFLESGQHPSETWIRPWFWILLLFIGPTVVSISFQSYILTMTRSLVRAEAILTQLIFEHSLRVRVKAEVDDGAAGAKPVTEAQPSENNAENNNAQDDQGSTSNTSIASSPTATNGNENPKGKDQSTESTPPEPPKAPLPNRKIADNFMGKLNNLVTIDLTNVVNARDLVLLSYHMPVQMVLCMIFLYQVLGWSSFVGLASMVALLPAPGVLAKWLQIVQKKKMDMTDGRVQIVTETMNILRMVKLFGWEKRMMDKIENKRDGELKLIWTERVLELATGTINFMIPTVTMVVTYATYTIIMKEDLTAAKVFSSMSVFDMMRNHLHRVSWQISQLIRGKVSLDRFNKFLNETELLDTYTPTSQPALPPPSILDSRNELVGFRDAAFTWVVEHKNGTLTPSSRSYTLTIKEELLFKRGKINLIIGPTGSGKTSMLMALLGEMHFVQSTPTSWFNLPRGGGVAYAAQESWVQNETIRDNILFSSAYNEQRYKKVLYQCALERDLELFEAGDMTEVGERGLTLSGGQKARVTLARAIYSEAEIVLLDDVLAALDVHTSKWIVNKCLRGDLVKGRTVLLVTHNVALASPAADFIVSLGVDGQVHSQGSDLSSAVSTDPQLLAEFEEEQEILHDKEVTSETEVEAVEKQTKGKLIVAEEIQEGNVSWKTIKVFLRALGGKHVTLFFIVWISSSIFNHVVSNFSLWFLGYWGSQYERHAPGEVPVLYYMTLYCVIILIMVLAYTACSLYYMLATMRASRTIHSMLTESILGTTLRWLDATPVSRIITRSTQDIGVLDTSLVQSFEGVTELAVVMVVDLVCAVLFVPIFTLPGLVIAAVGIYLGSLYLKAQLSVKREMSNAKSPMLAHFGAAMAGLVSIRAYGAQTSFKRESLRRIDHYVRIARNNYDLNRWIGIRIDALGAIFTASLAIYLVYFNSISAANTGFSLTTAVEFCTVVLYIVRVYNQFQVEANSLERIVGYTEIEQEPKSTEAGKPPAAWPTSGDLRVDNLSAQYSKTGPVVLHNLSFHVKAGERIGIVGRTGSGKSSLTLSLLRCILTEGTVYYDGLPTDTVNLDSLRSSITIIPQVPELLSGTLRHNLDPFEQYDDAILNDALRSSGLFSLQNPNDEARLTLDSNIASGGGNLSVGQRQIIALGRAIVRGTKLLILDEATSAIDHKTDSAIQTTLRTELGNDVTVLTVAHRLQTIMDADKIMVLDSGRIAEFASPAELLSKDGSLLKALVDESGDKEALYNLAEKSGSSSTL